MWLSKRPLSRQIIRHALRLRYGAALGHAQDWTPHLRIILPQGNEPGEAYYRNRPLTRLLAFEDFQAMTGDACGIVGSGPSLRRQRLDRLRDHALVYLNGAVCRIMPDADHPPLVAVEDERFIWRHFDMLRKHVDEPTGLLLSVAALRAIAEIDARWLRDRRVFLINNLLKPYGAPRRHIGCPELKEVVEGEGAAALSLCPQTGVVPAGTVALTAMQWVMARRPVEIGFAGIDLSNADEPRFYEANGRKAKSGIRAGSDRILAHFASAIRRCQARGMRLATYSRVSALRGLGVAYDSKLDDACGQPPAALATRQSGRPKPATANSGGRA